jgi:hypothetical protein
LSLINLVGIRVKLAIMSEKTAKVNNGGRPTRFSVLASARVEAKNIRERESVIGKPRIALMAIKIGKPGPLAKTY